MAETLGRALEQFFLRLGQDFAAGRLELRQHRLARFAKLPDLLVEIGGIGLERRQLDPRIAQFGDRLAELRIQLARFAIADEEPLAQLGQRPGAEKPAKRGAKGQAGYERDGHDDR